MGASQSLIDRVERLENEIHERALNTTDLAEENIRLQRAYDNLYARHTALVALTSSETVSSSSSSSSSSSPTISSEKIAEFVDTIIDDPRTNIYGFPDKMERAMYTNVLHIALLSLGKVLSASKIEVIGHNIQATISPSEETN